MSLPGTRIAGERDGDRLLITLQGSLDAMSATALQSQLYDLTQVHDLLGLGVPVRQIHIDLAGVDFCDAAGLRMLVAARRVAEARQATCHLHAPQPHLRWLLRATRAADLFHLH
ncbi:anti-anti-sigma factor [Actinoplanes lutulentus]|uniref:Anti-anti-sigma factor n=1 Tax=Actinoplanes lutulentus TaxID=1287878 RepID=A0A327ZKI1_9ACTN|nr:STAS domain-containing protein [Actinoplanes lutulentus]MBB2943992.1 anti-anti-sigma factor [Actinoplanes lutulentus]RAK42775.1 anti-anti-sigma factor [Actinoplanes lutulentus]